jgi:SAM-dependent methyltransferase
MWVFEWTGEQFLPAERDAAGVYQHVHRYMYISEFLKGKRVLDAASRDGSGSNILAGAAASVVGIVADARTADGARDRYKKPNLEFTCESIDTIPLDHSFDAIVFFDAIDSEAVLTDVKRLLTRDGLFIVSVPCRDENSVEDLRKVLMRHFSTAQIFAQGVYGVSIIEPAEATANTTFKQIAMTREGASRPVPSHLIGIAADSRLTILELGSIFTDQRNDLLKEKEKMIEELLESKAYQAKAMQWFESQLAERRESLASLQEAFAWHTDQIKSLTKTREYLESEISHFRNTVASHEQALAWRANQVAELETAVDHLTETITNLQSNIDRLRVRLLELDAIKASTGWKFVLRVRSIRDRLLPEGTVRHRLYKTITKFAKPRAGV